MDSEQWRRRGVKTGLPDIPARKTPPAKGMRVSIVIPVYNTAASLGDLVDRICSQMRVRYEDAYEVILVDDCSPNPDTWPALEEIARVHPEVRVLQLTRNFGQQAATLCGMAASAGDVVVTMDDDGQHDPADIPKLLAQASHDIVIGQFASRQHSPIRRFTSWLKGWFDYFLIKRPRHIRTTSFRCIRRTVVEGMLAFRTPHPFLPALMFHVSRDVVGVDVSHNPRREGKTGYTFFQMVAVFSNLIINNSTFLLRLVGGAGVLAAGGSFALAIGVVWRKLTLGVPIVGWTSLMVAVLFFGGMSLLSIGLVGEYLLRAIEAGEAKPTWVVRRAVGFGVVSDPSEPSAC